MNSQRAICSTRVILPVFVLLLFFVVTTSLSALSPGTASAPAYATSSPITVDYSGASATDGLKKVELWYGQEGKWTCSTDIPKSIPDNGTVISTQAIGHSGTILDVDVKLTIMHTYCADMDVYLEAPDGTLVELFTDVDGSADNFIDTILDDEAATSIASGSAPFTGSFRPEGLLSTLDGKNSAGTWKLRATDDSIGDTGTLQSWCIRLTTSPAMADWVYSGLSSTTASGSFNFVPPSEGRYYFALVAEDDLGNRSPDPTGSGDCSTMYDATPPTPGTASSPAYTKTSPINVSYSGAADALSGLKQVRLWYKAGRDGTWTDSGMASSASSGNFGFVPPSGDDNRYYFDLVAEDNAGNFSSAASGDGDCDTIYDTIAPSAPTSCNAPAVATAAFSVSYSGTADNPDGSGLKKVELWYKKGDGAWVNSYMTRTTSAGSFSFTPLSGAGTYYFCFVVEDNAGNRSDVCSGSGCAETIFDNTLPTTPIVKAGAYSSSTSKLSATWSATDEESGIAEYQYAIGTSSTDPGSGYLVAWKSAGASTGATETGLSLSQGQTYYWYVKAKNNAGGWSSAGVSDGVKIVQHGGIKISEAKLLVDGETVGLSDKVVSAVFEDHFYVQEPDRLAGIKVAPVPSGLSDGQMVDIGGTLLTYNSERYLEYANVEILGDTALKPIGMSNQMIGGSDFFYDSGTGAGQQGVTGGSGVNNIGLLIRTWGRVTWSSSGAAGSWSLDTDPGWTAQGQWAYGIPTGGGGGNGYPDPTSGYTGSNVYGVNLNGNYNLAVGGPWYLTTGPINCSGKYDLVLKFRRWLNTDYTPYTTATVQVSNNGTSWTTVWPNGSTAITDSQWVLCSYPISSTADNQSTVYVRWGYSVASSAYAYSGWNIDDIEIVSQGNMCTIEDGSLVNLSVVTPAGVNAPPSDSYVAITGISALDDMGSITRSLKVRKADDIQVLVNP